MAGRRDNRTTDLLALLSSCPLRSRRPVLVEERWRKRRICGRITKMSNVAVDVSRMTREEQMDLLDQLWEEVGRDPQALPLTAEQRDELDRRLDSLEAEGLIGVPWDEVVQHLRAQAR